MRHLKTPVTAPHRSPRRTLIGYVTGFALSLLLTVTAYMSVVNHASVGWTAVGVIVGLGVVQLLVQLLFFLHLGEESRPRLNLVVFLFMLLVLGIVVGGSLWIMHNLNYSMTPEGMQHYMLQQVNSGGI
jgi:cytochrome o ubiquinol oxidase operon protein cyoD